MAACALRPAAVSAYPSVLLLAGCGGAELGIHPGATLRRPGGICRFGQFHRNLRRSALLAVDPHQPDLCGRRAVFRDPHRPCARPCGRSPASWLRLFPGALYPSLRDRRSRRRHGLPLHPVAGTRHRRIAECLVARYLEPGQIWRARAHPRHRHLHLEMGGLHLHLPVRRPAIRAAFADRGRRHGRFRAHSPCHRHSGAAACTHPVLPHRHHDDRGFRRRRYVRHRRLHHRGRPQPRHRSDGLPHRQRGLRGAELFRRLCPEPRPHRPHHGLHLHPVPLRRAASPLQVRRR